MTTNNKPDVSKIENYDLTKIQQELQQFIRNTEKIIPKKIQKNASIFLKKIFAFNKQQQKFIDTFFNEKKILSELNSIDKTKLKQHPALLHKLQKLK